MNKRRIWVAVSLVLSLGLLLGIFGCTQAVITPTPTPSPSPTPTATPEAWVPVWKDGKLQPLPDGFPNGPITLWNMWTPGHLDEIYLRTMVTAAQPMTDIGLGVQTAAIGPRVCWGMLDKFQTLPKGQEGY